jgi:hypothetical protein
MTESEHLREYAVGLRSNIRALLNENERLCARVALLERRLSESESAGKALSVKYFALFNAVMEAGGKVTILPPQKKPDGAA